VDCIRLLRKPGGQEKCEFGMSAIEQEHAEGAEGTEETNDELGTMSDERRDVSFFGIW
jgi:hypothetical protein